MAIGFEDGVFPELVTAGRALGMGGAYVARADDSSSVFYNPAGLGSVRGWQFHMSNFHIEFNKRWSDAAAGGQLLEATTNITKAFDIDGLRQLAGTSTKPMTSRFSVMPNLTTRYFSAGFLYAMTTRATYNSTSAKFEYADRLDYGPYAALTLALFGGVVKFGAMTILQTRSEAIGDADPNVTLTLTDTDYNGGTFFNVTGGVKVTLPIAMLPTFAAKMHNVLGSTFSAGTGTGGAPTKIKSSMDLGFSISPQLGKITRLHFDVDWKDFSGLYTDTKLIRKILFGAELDFARTFFFRLGYSDGYGSFGIGVKAENIQVDLSSYARDLSASEYRGIRDRRFALTLSSGI